MFPVQSSTDAVSNFINAASALETRLHDAEARADVLLRNVSQLQRRQELIQRSVTQIRRSHRRASHAATARAIKQTLDLFTIAIR